MSPLDFFGKITGKKEKKNTSYLALALTPDRILAYIWNFQDEQIKNLGFGHKSYQNLDVLIHQAAVAIDMAGEQAKVDVTKAVFGLSNDWFEDGDLSKQTTKLLKQMSQELELDPQAFVPLPSSINHLLKTEEAVTPNAILVGIFNEFCEVHLLENNSVVKTNVSKAQINIEKIEKLIEQLKDQKDQLPAKLIVYGVSESSPLGEKIGNHDWKNIFIHEPKVEFLDENELVRSVAYAQAADILGFEPTGAAKTSQAIPLQPHSSANELGFVEGEDILSKQETSATEESDGLEETGTKENYAVESQIQNLTPTVPSEQLSKEKRKSISPLGFFASIIPDTGSLFALKSGKKIVIGAIVVIILFLLAGFAASFILTKAEVAIKVTPKPQEEEFIATVAEGGSFDPIRSQIPGSSVVGVADGNQKLVTTGTKTIGDPAKGEVNIFNWTTAPKTFSQKTGIITKNGVKFSLDFDVEIASRSASTPGQAKTNATAVEVGIGGNIDSGTDFTFQQFDAISYSAQASSTFAGGSERQTTVVTAEDMAKLEKSLTDTLFQKAKEDLKNKAGGTQVQDDATLLKITEKQFDRKLDEETAILNLDMQVEARAIVYDESELKKLLTEILQKDIDEKLQARPENIDIIDLVTKQEEGKLRLSGKIKADLVPKFNEEDLKGKIAGKSIKSARATILETGQASDVQINFSPNLPFIFSLPRNKEKISFKIET
ncbi:MAG: hypothetical protein Q8P25_02095 [Candidatus Curtissbacteria bacterium]|nr:hypothetical protein [Candidatus Curtissbacteria bacterium]